MQNHKGFTLIELMIVVAIIAILAAIAISQYQDYVIRSQVSEAATLAESLKIAIAEFHNFHGRFSTGGNASYGMVQPASIVGSYIGSVGISSGTRITAHFAVPPTGKANPKLNGQFLVFSPVTHAGSMEWVCNPSNLLLRKWVPPICRHG
jgi:type IV pilus assembly protein PilA